MKKTFALIFVVLVVALTLCACTTPVGGGINYSTLNQIAKENYSTVTLVVKTTWDNETLTSTFSTKFQGNQTTVNYSVEQYSQLSLTDVPQSYKQNLIGSIVVKDGKVVEQDGQQVDINITAITTSGLNFKSSHFQNAKLSGVTFTANVTDVSAFLGYDLKCTNMKVTVLQSQSLNKITINYVAENGSSVEMVYTLVK